MDKSAGRFLVMVACWGLAVAAAGALHLLVRLPAPALPVAVASATAALSVGVLRGGWLNSSLAALGLRRILAVHVARFVGFAFIWLHAQGRLPAQFAERAGWGDVITAAGALALFFCGDGVGFRRALWVWNGFGLLDLLVAVGTATWLNLTRPGSMAEMAVLPFCLIPFWAVPLLLSTHVFLMGKGFREGPADGEASPRSLSG